MSRHPTPVRPTLGTAEIRAATPAVSPAAVAPRPGARVAKACAPATAGLAPPRRAALVCAVAAALGPASPLSAQDPPEPVWSWPTDRVMEQVNIARAGRDLTPESWPDGARVAVLLSFDVDNETLYLDPRRPDIGALSEGEYGARVGLPRILELLDRHRIPASFFIPAVSLEIAPEMADAIVASGRHEVGLHGWIHENNAALPPGAERELTERALRYLERVTGGDVVGYRAPSWVFSERTPGIIRELGFLYDSSLMADDRPYELVADGEPTGVVELPITWILDDYPLMRPLGDRYSSPAQILEVWKSEFDRAYDERTVFILTMHPHVIGRRSRIAVLEALIQYIRARGEDVWFATHRAAAEWVRERAGSIQTSP